MHLSIFNLAGQRRLRPDIPDAWIAAAALKQGAGLIYQDPEFRGVGVAQEELAL